MANTGFVGPNGNSESIITHAAIASWAGFVYQGLCALCVAMEKLLDNDKASDWYLNIEGYEDFAILDADKQILSFHQCKDYKTKRGWKDEFGKMDDKRAYWYQKGMCEENAELWFHTNLEVAYSNDVKCYLYRNGFKTPTINDVFEMLQDLVAEYCEQYDIPVSSKRASDCLIAHVENLVSELDVEDKKVVNKTQQLSVERSIPFKKLDEIIRVSEEDRTIEEKVRLSVFYINLYLKECLEEEPDVDATKVICFLNRINAMDIDEKNHLVKRLFPDINIEKGVNSATEISNSPRVNYLYKVLTQTVEELDLEKVHWHSDGTLQSPSTMGNDMSAKRYCDRIATNTSLPAELLRDYDWILGCFDETVEDILGTASNITCISEIDYNDITKTRKTGLLSIKDKNDGKL